MSVPSHCDHHDVYTKGCKKCRSRKIYARDKDGFKTRAKQWQDLNRDKYRALQRERFRLYYAKVKGTPEFIAKTHQQYLARKAKKAAKEQQS